MKKLHKNQLGFSIEIIILMLLLIILLAIIGWWVMSQKKQKSSAPQSSTPSSQQAEKSKTKPTPPPPAVKYLEIKEWGLKMPIGDDISGAYYTVRQSVQGDPAEYVDIFDGGFDGTANSKGVKCLDKTFPLFVIGRVKQADLAKVEGPDADGYKKLDVSDTYLFNGSEAHQAYPVCANLTPNGNYTEDKTIIDLLSIKQKAITTAYSKIVKL